MASSLYSIKQTVATYLNVAVADLTVDGVDLFLDAVNQVRREAEQTNDFEFSRKLVQLAVNGVTGGDLGDAVLKSDGTTPVNVKTVIEVGQFDSDGNLRPVEWTTVAEGLERVREDQRYTWLPRSPSDGYFETAQLGLSRVVFSGDKVFMFPFDSENNYTLGMEVYSHADDWLTAGGAVATVTVSGTLDPDITGAYKAGPVINDQTSYLKVGVGRDELNAMLLRNSTDTAWQLAPFDTWGSGALNLWTLTTASESPAGSYTPSGNASGSATVALGDSQISDIWIEQGGKYLTWASIVLLNHRFKEFVFRQEGNLPPPKDLAEAGLAALKSWDSYRYDQFRRHGR